MQFTNSSPLVLLLATLSILPTSVLAADCIGDSGKNPLLSTGKQLIDKLCNQRACDTTGPVMQPGFCKIHLDSSGGSAFVSAGDKSGKFENCETAMTNILEQCMSTGDFVQSSGQAVGVWSAPAGPDSYEIVLTQVEPKRTMSRALRKALNLE